ncbi:MAG TPA: hypothetical protein VLH15_05495 [Dehalococcoidales bacterium]|nr:hypothetical protein [Dehalococcoidales bacterium]
MNAFIVIPAAQHLRSPSPVMPEALFVVILEASNGEAEGSGRGAVNPGDMAV